MELTKKSIVLEDSSNHSLEVYSFNSNKPGPKIYIQAGIHGNEPPGILLASQLVEKIRRLSADNAVFSELTIVPLCNPLALEQISYGEIIGRFDVNSGINFNRNFADVSQQVLAAASNYQKLASNTAQKLAIDMLSEIEASDTASRMKLELQKLAYAHDLVIDLHADTKSVLHIYAPERLDGEIEKLASALNCDLVLESPPHSDGGFDDSFNYFWSEIEAELIDPEKKPQACTVELRGRYDIDESLLIEDLSALIQFLFRPASGQPDNYGNQPKISLTLNIDTVIATRLSCFRPIARLGQEVKKGDKVGEFLDPKNLGEGEPMPLIANIDGLFFTHSHLGVVPKGHTLYKIAGFEPVHNSLMDALES